MIGHWCPRPIHFVASYAVIVPWSQMPILFGIALSAATGYWSQHQPLLVLYVFSLCAAHTRIAFKFLFRLPLWPTQEIGLLVKNIARLGESREEVGATSTATVPAYLAKQLGRGLGYCSWMMFLPTVCHLPCPRYPQHCHSSVTSQGQS